MKRLLLFLLLSTQFICAQVFTENFNSNSLPSGWTVANPNTNFNWNVGTQNGFASFPNGAAFFDDDEAGPASVNANAQLISPAINLGNISNPKLSFKYANMIYDYNSGIKVEAFNGTSWIEIFSSYGDAGDWGIDWNTFQYLINNYQEITDIDLTLYANANFQLRFVYNDMGDYSYGAVIDDILIEGSLPLLLQPSIDNILYVNKNVSGGTQLGNSWANAVPELADALKWAKQNESQWTDDNPLQIWVAEGTYKPMYSPADNNFGNPDGRQNSFLVVKNVSMYGGFHGQESNLSERNWNENPTILSGEIQNDGEKNNNAYHVMTAAGDLGSAVIDGFIVQDGNPLIDVGESQFITNGFIFQNRVAGGIIAMHANLIVNNSVFRNNDGYAGIAIHNFLGDITVNNSLFYNNSSSSGNVITSNSVKLVNVTISKNLATRVIHSEQLNIANSILWGNDLYETLAFNQIDIQNSIIENYNESSDPLFTDQANGDFTLTRNSPAINSGNNYLYGGLDENTVDLAGNPRLFGMNIDMGAYEFQSEVISPNENNILYVNKNVSGGNQRGNSWANAVPELADALKYAKLNESNWTADNPLQIWVAEGTYIPLYSPADNNFGNPDGRQNSFLIVKDVLLYGGFHGQESNLSERNWNENPTILSGEIQNDGEKNNNAYHVMTAAGDIGSTIIDGFIIQEGITILDSGYNQFITNGYIFQNRLGGGITCLDSDLVINNSIFRNNEGYGGIAIQNTYGSTTVSNSLFYDNLVQSHGYVIGSDSLKLINVTISKNSATYLIYSDQLSIMNSLLWGNQLNYNLFYNQINVQNSIIENYNGSPDPLFTDAANGDFSLQACSPAVNSGNNSLFDGLDETTLDLAGNPRLFGTNIDMGAYEFQSEQINYSDVSFEDLTVTYNESSHSIEIENLPEGINVSYEITNEQNQTTNGNSTTDAGIYQIKAILSGCGEPQEFNAVLTIEKAQAVITADATQTRTYNGTLQIVTASLNHVETALSYAPQQGYTNAGTYIITVSAEETDNYLGVSEQITLIIENADWNPGGGSGVTLPDETYTYNGNSQSVEVENLPQDATVTYTITDAENNTESGNSAINAGNYSVHALVEIPNYNDIELSAELIINKAEAIITANEVQTHVYDGTIKNVVASLNHNETTLQYTPQQGYIDAGTYQITISAVETQNYLAVSKPIDLIIENADFEGIEFDGGEFTYDGMEHSILVSNEPENAAVTYTNNGQTNAGTYNVSALIQMPNYNDLTLTAELIINKAEAIISANEAQTHVYDGTIKNVVASLNHNETTLQYSPQQGYMDAGTYPITVSAVETQNYLSASIEINLIIENADFEGIEFDSGEFTYDGMAHSIFVSNEPENATVAYTNNGQINAGTYTVSALIQMPNYNDLTLTAELLINKAEAIITANEVQTHVYDGTIQNAVASLNHSETNLVYTPQQGYIDAGTYQITISAVETQNYLAVSKTIDLVIENADFEGIEFDGGEFTYDGMEHSILVSNEPENAAVTYTNNGQTNAGTYNVSALIQMPNYNDLTLTAELTIHKADQFITFNPIPVKHLENDSDFQLGALASSGLEVDYTFSFDTENPAAIVSPSGWVELRTSGSIWITAHQTGNENYNPAVSVERELEIVSSNNSIISINIHGETINNPSNEIYYLIDCEDDSTSINIEVETEAGATVVPGHNFSIEVPKPGIYRQTIVVTSQNGSVRNYELIIEKRFNFNEIVIQKFDNVLLVNNNSENNGGYEFDAYQWYKNGTQIGTGQYYSAGDNSTDTLDPNAVYLVKMRTTDGQWLSSCESGIELRSAYSVKIAPNPVYSGNVIKVIADFPEDELKNMKIKLFSMAGELILETNSNERITEIRLPAGMTSASYLVQVNTGKTVKNIQFLVK